MKRYVLCLLIVILLLAGCNQRLEDGGDATSWQGTQPAATSTIETEPPTDDGAVAARASVASAEQALERATAGPEPSEIEAARLEVTKADIALQQSRLSLEQARENLDHATLVAPRGGTIVSVEVPVGAAVAAGTPVVTLLDMGRLEFHTTNLSERDLAQIAPGQRAVVTLKAYPDEAIDATVSRIGVQAGGPVGGAATFPVILALGEADLDLRPGMTGEVEIGS